MPVLAAGGTDWTSVAALTGALIALVGFLISALRGRRADDLDTLIKVNAALREDNDELRQEVHDVKDRVASLEVTLVKCQRENGVLRRKLTRAGVA